MNPEKPGGILKDIIGAPTVDDEHDVYQEDGTYRAFGITRKAWGGEPMIDFITRDGNHQTLSYSHLYRMTFDPSKSITIEFTNHRVTIEGMQVHDLHRYLSVHRVLFVCEADDATRRLTRSGEDPVITKLAVEETSQLK